MYACCGPLDRRDSRRAPIPPQAIAACAARPGDTSDVALLDPGRAGCYGYASRYCESPPPPGPARVAINSPIPIAPTESLDGLQLNHLPHPPEIFRVVDGSFPRCFSGASARPATSTPHNHTKKKRSHNHARNQRVFTQPDPNNHVHASCSSRSS